jgi:hypothetical protein
VTAKKALLIALVILLALVGIPMLVPGMAMEQCPECAPTLTCAPCSAGILAAVAAVVMTLASSDLARGRRRNRPLLLSASFERPPQSI